MEGWFIWAVGPVLWLRINISNLRRPLDISQRWNSDFLPNMPIPGKTTNRFANAFQGRMADEALMHMYVRSAFLFKHQLTHFAFKLNIRWLVPCHMFRNWCLLYSRPPEIYNICSCLLHYSKFVFANLPYCYQLATLTENH